jgi:hypothetical protein
MNWASLRCWRTCTFWSNQPAPAWLGKRAVINEIEVNLDWWAPAGAARLI